SSMSLIVSIFFFQAEDGIRARNVTGVQTCALPISKALGPLGAGLSYYSNYHDAQADGVKGKKAHSRAVVDTTIDTAVGAGVQAGSVALFTAAVPIPGVGTAIGVGVGVLANWALNKKWDGKKSGMDVVKGGLRKIKGWFN